MAKISIEINDTNFDIGAFVSAFARDSKVTVNIFTSEDEIKQSDNLSIDKEGEIVIEDALPELTEQQLLNKLAKMPNKSMEQTLYAEKLYKENKITWIKIGKALGIRGDSIYRRVQAVHKKLDEKGRGKKNPTMGSATKVKKAKPKPKPKKPDVPSLSEKDIIETVYAVIRGDTKGMHFSTRISSVLIDSYSEKYENNKKLVDFKSSINSRIDDAMNKIALVLGPTACMVSQSRDHAGHKTVQLMVYTKNIPTHVALTKELKKLGLL